MFSGPQALAQSLLSPSAAFVQAGSGRRAHEVAAGMTWGRDLERALGPGMVTGYWEASLSR